MPRSPEAEQCRRAYKHLLSLVEQNKILNGKDLRDREAFANAFAFHSTLPVKERIEVNIAFASLYRFGLLPKNLEILGQISQGVLENELKRS